MNDAKKITAELRGHWFGHYGLAFCPAHDNANTPALSLKNAEDGTLLTYCHAGCTFQHVRDALMQRGLLPLRVGAPQKLCAPSYKTGPTLAQIAVAARKAKRATTLWRAATPMDSSLTMRYLSERAISCPTPPTLRSLGDCRHPSGKHIPTMIARVDGATTFAVHRTFLADDGSAKTRLHPAKAMLGSCKGGAVHLSSINIHTLGGPLVVTEGIENGLSLLSGLLDTPATVWAALSTSGITSLTLPRLPGHLIIAADCDTAGQQAARKLSIRADRLGWRISYLTPPPGQDWNDVLVQKREQK